MKFKTLLKEIIAILLDTSAEIDLSRFDPIIDKLIPITKTENGIIIKIGKLNYVVNQHFQSEGATAKDAIESAIIAKYESKTA